MHKKKTSARGSKRGGSGQKSTATPKPPAAGGPGSHNFSSATISRPAPGGSPPSGVRLVPAGEPTQDDPSDSYDPAHGGWGAW